MSTQDDLDLTTNHRPNSRISKSLMFSLGWIPIAFVLATVMAYFIPYFIATYTGHVYPFFPAISDSGILVPESLVFREMMNISGFLAITTTFIRFMQLRLITSSIDIIPPILVEKLSFLAMLVGMIGGLAITFVGNFQARKDHVFAPVSEYSIHNVAAVIVFCCGLLYCAMQSLISFKMKQSGLNTHRMCLVRTFITLSILTNFALFVIFSRWSNEQYDVGHGHTMKLRWLPEQEGYVQHVVSSIAEWLMCLSMVGYSLTFVREFNFIRITSDFSEDCSINDFLVNEDDADGS
eukprot:gene11254-12434_t